MYLQNWSQYKTRHWLDYLLFSSSAVIWSHIFTKKYITVREQMTCLNKKLNVIKMSLSFCMRPVVMSWTQETITYWFRPLFAGKRISISFTLCFFYPCQKMTNNCPTISIFILNSCKIWIDDLHNGSNLLNALTEEI